MSVERTSLAEQVAVQSCSGLFHQNKSGAGGSFVLGLRSQTEQWLAKLKADSTKTTLSVTNYLKSASQWRGKGYISTHRGTETQDRRLPQVISLAGVLDAVVLNDTVLSPEGATLLRDIATEWGLSATQHMIENYASQTTGKS